MFPEPALFFTQFQTRFCFDNDLARQFYCKWRSIKRYFRDFVPCWSGFQSTLRVLANNQSEIFFINSDFVEMIAARATKTAPRPKFVFFILDPLQLSVCQSQRRQVDKRFDKVTTQNEDQNLRYMVSLFQVMIAVVLRPKVFKRNI